MDYRFLALIVMILWGLQGFFIKVLLKKLPWTLYYVLGSVAALIGGLIIYLFFKPKITTEVPLVLAALLVALLGTVAYLLFVYTLNIGPASVVIPITSLSVAVAAALAVVFLGETITLKKAVGIIFAIIAILLVGA